MPAPPRASTEIGPRSRMLLGWKVPLLAGPRCNCKISRQKVLHYRRERRTRFGFLGGGEDQSIGQG